MSQEHDELMLDSAGPTATGFEIRTHAGGPQTADTLVFIADSMRSVLDEHNAPNYLEMELQASDQKRYIMTLQRKGHVTPHEARTAAEEALRASKSRVVETEHDVDALPVGSVVLDANEDVARKFRGGWRTLVTEADGTAWLSGHVEDPELPASVLHEAAV
jgi:hypothetical protein